MTTEQQGSLLNKTRTMLIKAKSNNELETIAHRTSIPFLWLNKIADGYIDDPSVNRIQKVYEYISDKKLC